MGTNDSAGPNWSKKDTLVPELQAMIDDFSALPSKPNICICLPVKIFGTQYGHDDTRLTQEVFPLLTAVAKKNDLAVIDLHGILQPKHCLASNLHPNAEGAKLIAQTIAAAITGTNDYETISKWGCSLDVDVETPRWGV